MAGCSNINPLVDRNTIIQATSKVNPNKHCTAIRRDIKIADGFGYQIRLQALVVSGTPISCPAPSVGRPGGKIGIVFNFFDSDNYRYVLKE